jgi:hypothetical protein
LRVTGAGAALDRAREIALSSEDRSLSPAAVLFLLRDYVDGGRPEGRHLVERGLAEGLDAVSAGRDACTQLEWLRVFAEASAASADGRLTAAIESGLPSAIDGLEGLIRNLYEPGDGLLDRECDDHVRCSSALVAAFDLSGRLPYAMLAEELMQHARRRWWDARMPAFDAGFPVNCLALHVLCCLAGFRSDADYRQAVAPPPATGYLDDARGLANVVGQRSGEYPRHAAEAAGALLEWFALASKLH